MQVLVQQYGVWPELLLSKELPEVCLLLVLGPHFEKQEFVLWLREPLLWGTYPP